MADVTSDIKRALETLRKEFQNASPTDLPEIARKYGLAPEDGSYRILSDALRDVMEKFFKIDVSLGDLHAALPKICESLDISCNDVGKYMPCDSPDLLPHADWHITLYP